MRASTSRRAKRRICYGLMPAGLASLCIVAGSRRVYAQAVVLAPRPPAPAPAAFRFPEVVSRTLPNGLRLMISENHSVPVVAVYAVVDADSTQDPPDRAGLSDVVKRAMGQASTRFTSRELDDTVAALGVRLSDTSFTTRSDEVVPALDIMADLLAHPVFSDGILATAKAQALQDRRNADAARFGRVKEEVYDVLFGPDAAYTRRGDSASIGSITLADVRSFHERLYAPSRTTLVMVGDVTPSQAQHYAEAAFGSWSGATGNSPRVSETTAGAGMTPPAAQARATTIYLVDRPGARQSTIMLGALGPTRGSPEFAAASAFDAEFDGTLSSRLPRVLRQQHAWAYTVAGRIDARGMDEPTVMWTAADVAPESTDSAIVASLAELRKSGADDSFRPADVEAARDIVSGSIQRLIATDDALAARLEELAKSHLPLDYFSTFVAALGAVTPAQVAAAASKFENPDRMVIAVLGDRAAVEKPLRATGLPVVIVPAGQP